MWTHLGHHGFDAAVLEAEGQCVLLAHTLHTIDGHALSIADEGKPLLQPALRREGPQQGAALFQLLPQLLKPSLRCKQGQCLATIQQALMLAFQPAAPQLPQPLALLLQLSQRHMPIR